jgi:hypothetical protein
VDIVIQKLIEDFEENKEGNSKYGGCNEENTAPDWEEAAAGEIFCFLIGALAKTAAYHESTVL